jgi:hypothetical protein
MRGEGRLGGVRVAGCSGAFYRAKGGEDVADH